MGRGRIRWSWGRGSSRRVLEEAIGKGAFGGEVEISCNGNSQESLTVSLAISPSSRRCVA